MSLRVRNNDAIAGEFQGIEDAGVSTSWRLQTDTYMCIDTGAGSRPSSRQFPFLQNAIHDPDSIEPNL